MESAGIGEERDGTVAVAQLSYRKGWALQCRHGTENRRRDSRDNAQASKTCWGMNEADEKGQPWVPLWGSGQGEVVDKGAEGFILGRW